MRDAERTSRGSSQGAGLVGPRLRPLAAAAVALAALLGLAATVRAGSVADAVGTIALSSVVSPATLGLGTGFSDTATLTPPPGGPTPSGTITFRVYGPADPGCTGPVRFSSTNTLAGLSTPSSGFTPPSLGTYEVIAIYSGDASYAPVSSTCGDPAEVAVVGPRPTLTGLSPSSGPAGGLDTVTITGTDLTGASTVNFGSVPTAATVISPTEVIATAPAGAAGPVNVTVTTPFGTTPVVGADVYTYAPATAAGLPATPIVSGIPQRPPVVETGAATAVTSTTAKLTGTVDPGGLAGTAQFEYTVRLPGGASRTARTPVRSIGPLAGPVTAEVAGLQPERRYRVRLLATDAAGSTVGGATSFVTVTGTPVGRPLVGQTFSAAPISGLVAVRLPGAGQAVTQLTAARHLPVGTTLDTRHGAVLLTTATAGGGERSGSFSGGTFTVSQAAAGAGVPELRLVRPSTTSRLCAAGAGQSRPATVLGLVRAIATGRFEVRGRYGAASGSGATWTTSDRCDGLLTSVGQGLVEVSAPAGGRRVTVRAGTTYLEKAA
ncbi:MAG TPA: IPT/TIG domain-containing protein [Solirubrobacteraceae bacterium]|jgi:hypothetical protein|nr:IPT/TIG domain-containing protein [Solirubrobacteraceae bacterium]